MFSCRMQQADDTSEATWASTSAQPGSTVARNSPVRAALTNNATPLDASALKTSVTMDANKNRVTSPASQESRDDVAQTLHGLRLEASSLNNNNTHNHILASDVTTQHERDVSSDDIPNAPSSGGRVDVCKGSSAEVVLNNFINSPPGASPRTTRAAQSNAQVTSEHSCVDAEAPTNNASAPASARNDVIAPRTSSSCPSAHASLARSQSASVTSSSVIESVTSSRAVEQTTSGASPARLKRQPTKETRTCSVSDSDGYTQLNQYRLKDEIGKVQD